MLDDFSLLGISIGYLIRVRDTGDRSAVAETMCSQIGAQAAVMPLLKKAYVQSLERRTCRLQPKFFGELAQVHSRGP